MRVSRSSGRPRVVSCKAKPGHKLWLQFSDGLEGNVYLGNLLEIGAFKQLRDAHVFLTARINEETGAIVWPGAGVRLDPDILYADLAAHGIWGSVPKRARAARRSAPPAPDRQSAALRITQALEPLIGRVKGIGALVTNVAPTLYHKIKRVNDVEFQRLPGTLDLRASGSLHRAIEDLEAAREYCGELVATLKGLQGGERGSAS